MEASPSPSGLLSCTNTQTWPSSQSWLEYTIPPPPPLVVRQKIQYLGSEKIMVTKWPSHWNFSRIFKNVLCICEIFLLIKKLQFSRNVWIFQEISRAKPPHQLVTSPYHLYYKTAIIWPKSTSSSLYVHLILGVQPSVKRALRSDRRKEENCSRNRNNWTFILRETCKKCFKAIREALLYQ